jgi:hypothetical protein
MIDEGMKALLKRAVQILGNESFLPETTYYNY